MLTSRSPYTQFRGELFRVLEPEFERLGSPIKVLEAGGGSATFLSESSHDFEFTTVDISAEQLMRNSYAQEKILGDIELYDYGSRRFSVVVCFDVLEHLKFPERALARLVEVLEPGGLIVVKGPIPQSLQGLVTRFTPHWLHVLYYRWMWPSSQAGQPGHAPFPTEHTTAARPEAVRRALQSAGLDELQYVVFQGHSAYLRRQSSVLYFVFLVVAHAVQLVTLGRYGATNSEFALTCRRPRR